MAAVELSPGGWTAALGGALLMHAALAAGVAPLLRSAQARAPVTEITFSEPQIESLPAARPSTPAPSVPSDEVETLTPFEAFDALWTSRNASALPGLRTADAAASPGAEQRAGAMQAAAVARPARDAAAAATSGGALLPAGLPTPLGAMIAGDSLAATTAAEPVMPAVAEAAVPAASASALMPRGAAAVPLPLRTVEDVIAADAEADRAAPMAPLPGVIPGRAAVDALPAAQSGGGALAPLSGGRVGIPAVAAESVASPAAPARRLASSGAGAPLAAENASEPSLTIAQVIAADGDAVAPASAERLVSAAAEGAGSRLAPASENILRPAGGATVLSSLEQTTDGSGTGRGSAAWNDAVGFVRGFGGDGCFAALPVESGERVGLEAFGADRGEIRRFAEASVSGLSRPTAVTGGNLAEIQCSALRLARSSKLYPDFALSIALERPAGAFDEVTGQILGGGTRAVQLLLIDEAGEVQTVARFAPGPDEPLRFDFPFSREELADARALFLAVASDKPLSNLDFDVKEMAAPTFFRLLERESKAADAALDIALVAFDLELPAAGISSR